MAEYLHELRPRPATPTRDDVLAECFARLDAIGLSFASNEERASAMVRLLAEQGYQVLPSIPAFPERAIR